MIREGTVSYTKFTLRFRDYLPRIRKTAREFEDSMNMISGYHRIGLSK